MLQKKIDIEFCLTNNSVNVYGYRLLTEGLQLERFKPCIGFLMHNRNAGVAVRWEDFRIEDDKLYAKPVVNTSVFPQLAEQIEGGFYSAASMGHIVALELNDEDLQKLPEQTGPTVTKWFPRECSIVDIPGNYSALAQLYDENDGILQDLSANINKPNKKEKMEKNQLTPGDFAALNLAVDATQEQTSKAIADLAAKAKKADTLEKELNDMRDKHNAERIEAILKQGMTDRKVTKELADALKKDYANNPDSLQLLVAALQSQKVVTKGVAEKDTPSDLPERYKGKTYNDLYLSGELELLKTDYPEYYETLKNKQ